MQRLSSKAGRRINPWPYLFSAPFIIAFLSFSVFPILFSFYLSGFNWNGFTPVKTFVGLGNYIRLMTVDKLFWRAMANSGLFVVVIVPLNMLLGVLMAYVLHGMKRGRRFFQTMNFLPYITTPVAIGVIFSYIFDWNSGILNEVLLRIGLLGEKYAWLHEPWSARMVVVLMCVWRNLGYYVTIYLSAMLAVPSELYEAAHIDGAGSAQTFFHVVLPSIRRTTVFLMITGLIGGFQLFDEPVQLYSGWSAGVANVGGPEYSVYTVIWKFYNDAYKTNIAMGYASAEANILFILIAVLSLMSFFITSRKEQDA